jgi:hypothetical protein
MPKPVTTPLCACGDCQAALDRALKIFQDLRKEHHCDVWFTGVAVGIELIVQNSIAIEPRVMAVALQVADAMSTNEALDYLNEQLAAIDGAIREPHN